MTNTLTFTFILLNQVKVKSLSRVPLFGTPWTVACQAPPSMGFSRQECWSGLPSPSPGDLPNPGIEPRSPALYTDALPSEPPGKPIAEVHIKSLLRTLQPPRPCHLSREKNQFSLTGNSYSRSKISKPKGSNQQT